MAVLPDPKISKVTVTVNDGENEWKYEINEAEDVSIDLKWEEPRIIYDDFPPRHEERKVESLTFTMKPLADDKGQFMMFYDRNKILEAQTLPPYDR